MSIESLMRANIAALSPYRCARDEFEGQADVYLDANESWRDYIKETGRNRYPDPRCTLLRKALDEVLGLPFANTVIGNGSDELIDLLFRIFCTPGRDSVLLMDPTYGAYRVFAAINDVRVLSVPLSSDFAMDLDAVIATMRKEHPRLVFICSPNNPTGTSQSLAAIEQVLKANEGITVVDEAYFEFSGKESAIGLIKEYERLVVLRTLSKCWALAGARIGIAIATPVLQKKMIDVKYPYNVSSPAQECALRALSSADAVIEGVRYTKLERKRMEELLPGIPGVVKVYPSDANFLLVKTHDATALYHYLVKMKIIVRNRTNEYNCNNDLRITIGSRAENDRLLQALKDYPWN